MKHFIFDFETAGQDIHSCAILDMACYVFTTEQMLSSKPYTLDTVKDVKRFKFDLSHQRSQYKYKVEEDTTKFWYSQPKHIFQRIIPRDDDLLLEDFSEQLLEYLEPHKINYWWSRSNTFDPIILWRIFKDTKQIDKLHQKLPHWGLRDTRSFIDGALNFPKKNGFIPVSDEKIWNDVFELHNSSWDIVADILRIQAIVRTNHNLEI